ncbi:inositol phosphatase-domain-containing protein, partial [Thamnocephalis sphaerospora]
NAFRDYFRQIDVFKRVLASTNGAQQPGDEDRWMKIRANAVEISSSIVIGDGEMLLNGWTLLSPVTPHLIRDKAYEEKVVLLTQLALYVCTFHYALEKVVEFVRISLDTITGIQRGEYILSTARAEYTNPDDNYGFIVRYKPEGEAARFNSGSVRNNRNSIVSILGPSTSLRPDPTRIFAFKAIPPGIVNAADLHAGRAVQTDAEQHPRCVDIVAGIVAEIAVACRHIGHDDCDDLGALIANHPVISLEEALENTSLVSKVGNRLKKAVLS